MTVKGARTKNSSEAKPSVRIIAIEIPKPKAKIATQYINSIFRPVNTLPENIQPSPGKPNNLDNSREDWSFGAVVIGPLLAIDGCCVWKGVGGWAEWGGATVLSNRMNSVADKGNLLKQVSLSFLNVSGCEFIRRS
jgi:hypothetical protein